MEGSKKPRAVKDLSPALHEVLKAQYESLKCFFFFAASISAQVTDKARYGGSLEPGIIDLLWQ